MKSTLGSNVVVSAIRRTWLVGAIHEAFGSEGVREYVGTERCARILAGKIAHKGGHGWRPYVSEHS